MRKSRRSKPGALTVVTKASREDLNWVANKNHLEVEDLTDIFDTQEIPRLEQLGKTTLMIVRYPVSLEPDEPTTQHLFLIYYQKKLTLLAAGELRLIDDVFAAKQMIATTQSAKFMIQMLLYVSRQYGSKVNAIHKKLESVRTNLRKASTKDIETLIEYEAVLNEYLLALVPMQAMYQEIVSGKYIPLYAEDQALFDDLINSIAQSVDICKASVKQIISLRDSFEIIVSNRLNQTVKLLTSVTIIITIPTIISSIYGMNVSLPIGKNPYAFWWLSLIAVALMGIVGWVFRRNKWF